MVKPPGLSNHSWIWASHMLIWLFWLLPLWSSGPPLKCQPKLSILQIRVRWSIFPTLYRARPYSRARDYPEWVADVHPLCHLVSPAAAKYYKCSTWWLILSMCLNKSLLVSFMQCNAAEPSHIQFFILGAFRDIGEDYHLRLQISDLDFLDPRLRGTGLYNQIFNSKTNSFNEG